jgi:hypothetical protein
MVEKKQIHETRFREIRVRMIQGLVGSRLNRQKGGGGEGVNPQYIQKYIMFAKYSITSLSLPRSLVQYPTNELKPLSNNRSLVPYSYVEPK